MGFVCGKFQDANTNIRGACKREPIFGPIIEIFVKKDKDRLNNSLHLVEYF